MTDELNINRIPDFSASNLSFNADFNVSKPIVNSNFIFENYFSNPVSLGNFDCFNNISYIPQWNMQFNLNFQNVFSFKNFEMPKSGWNFSLPDFQSNFSPSTSFTQSGTGQSTVSTTVPDVEPKKAAVPSKTSQNTKTGTATGNSTRNYMHLSKAEAYKKAEKDPNLEKLTSGKNWSVCSNSFKTDIPFAKKGTSDILEKVAQMLGVKLVITSALGTGEPGNPHKKTGYDSHHNDENAKLDIRTIGNANDFAERLRKTGYFSHVHPEGDHIDVQIDISKFKEVV